MFGFGFFSYYMGFWVHVNPTHYYCLDHRIYVVHSFTFFPWLHILQTLGHFFTITLQVGQQCFCANDENTVPFLLKKVLIKSHVAKIHQTKEESFHKECIYFLSPLCSKSKRFILKKPERFYFEVCLRRTIFTEAMENKKGKSICHCFLLLFSFTSRSRVTHQWWIRFALT